MNVALNNLLTDPPHAECMVFKVENYVYMMAEQSKKAACCKALPFCIALRLIIKDILPSSQLGQNRHNMWQHKIHCDTTSYQCQQKEKRGKYSKCWAEGIKSDRGKSKEWEER